MHARGVDDGILYVLDGVPMPDRVDVFSSSSFNVQQFQSIGVLTSNVPAEYGGRSGAVVMMDSPSGAALPFPAARHCRLGRRIHAGAHQSRLGRAPARTAQRHTRYVYNFGNPFSGTHFGMRRAFTMGMRFTFGREDSRQ